MRQRRQPVDYGLDISIPTIWDSVNYGHQIIALARVTPGEGLV